jgi:hypothetical protein
MELRQNCEIGLCVRQAVVVPKCSCHFRRNAQADHFQNRRGLEENALIDYVEGKFAARAYHSGPCRGFRIPNREQSHTPDATWRKHRTKNCGAGLFEIYAVCPSRNRSHYFARFGRCAENYPMVAARIRRDSAPERVSASGDSLKPPCSARGTNISPRSPESTTSRSLQLKRASSRPILKLASATNPQALIRNGKYVEE